MYTKINDFTVHTMIYISFFEMISYIFLSYEMFFYDQVIFQVPTCMYLL